VTSTELVPVRQVSSGLVPLDAAVGAVVVAGGLVLSVTRRLAMVARPVGALVLHPPLLPDHLHPARAVDLLAERGRHAMFDGGSELDEIVAAVVPVVLDRVLDTIDLNRLILERVDLDGVVATVDVDGIVSRVDIDAIVSRVDVDEIAASIDLDAIVARLDIDDIVASVDLDAIIDRLNVVEIAEDVINEIDLPEIIRDSTGSMASQVVRDARVQSIDADQAVNRLVDRILRRRRDRSTSVPGHDPMADETLDEVPS
jgi:hypothetical protein